MAVAGATRRLLPQQPALSGPARLLGAREPGVSPPARLHLSGAKATVPPMWPLRPGSGAGLRPSGPPSSRTPPAPLPHLLTHWPQPPRSPSAFSGPARAYLGRTGHWSALGWQGWGGASESEGRGRAHVEASKPRPVPPGGRTQAPAGHTSKMPLPWPYRPGRRCSGPSLSPEAPEGPTRPLSAPACPQLSVSALHLL